jgi:hypothetical protein
MMGRVLLKRVSKSETFAVQLYNDYTNASRADI